MVLYHSAALRVIVAGQAPGAAKAAYDIIVDDASQITGRDFRNWHRSDLVRGGRAVPLCPGRSDVDLFRDGESVVDLNPQIAHGALDLLVAQQSCAIIRILLSH